MYIRYTTLESLLVDFGYVVYSGAGAEGQM